MILVLVASPALLADKKEKKKCTMIYGPWGVSCEKADAEDRGLEKINRLPSSTKKAKKCPFGQNCDDD